MAHLIPADTPVDIGRDDAARAAAHELSRGVYQRGPGDVFADLLTRVGNALGRVVDRLTGPGGAGGWVASVVVVALAVALVALGLWRLGPPARRSRERARGVQAATPVLDAAGHRAAAVRAAQAQDWAVAVRERFRAVTRELEQRGVLEPVPGRTALEIAADATAAVPPLGPVLRPAAESLGAVVYSTRAATSADLAAVLAADDAVAAVRFDAVRFDAARLDAGRS